MKVTTLLLAFAALAASTADCAAQALTLLQGPANQPYSQSSSIQPDSISIGSTPSLGVTITVVSLAPWLTVNNDCSTAGKAVLQTPVTVPFCVDPSKVAKDGYYVGLIEISATGYPTMRVPVHLTLFPTGDLSANPDTVNLDATHLSATVTVNVDPTGNDNNNGGFSNNLNFTTTLGQPNPAEGNWLTLSQQNPQTPGTVVVTANASQLTSLMPGLYTNTLVFTDTKYNNVKTATVNFNVQVQETKPALPHIAVGETWTTGFFVINSGTQSAQFKIDFYDNTGQPVALPFVGRAATSELVDAIPGQGSAYYQAGDPNFMLRGEWGLITADPTITVQALFRNNAGGGNYYEAGVPATSGGSGFVIPFDATTFTDAGLPFYTGFGVANLDANTAATITCVARATDGTVIPNGVPAIALAPLGHFANYLFPALAGMRGTLDCSSNTRIAAVAIRAIGFGAFSSLPVIIKP